MKSKCRTENKIQSTKTENFKEKIFAKFIFLKKDIFGVLSSLELESPPGAEHSYVPTPTRSMCDHEGRNYH